MPRGEPSVNALEIRVSRAGLRDAKGQYVKRDKILEEEVKRIHRSKAMLLQKKAADGIAVGSNRPGTGRLKKVTMSDRNMVYTPQGYGVGVPSFLNKSESRYWRTIEEGSKVTFSRGGFIGALIYPQIIAPKFKSKKALKSAVKQAGFNAWHTGVDPSGRFAMGSPGAPYGRGKIAAVSYAKGPQLMAQFPGYKPLIVKKEIEAQHYYSNAWYSSLNEIADQRATKVLLDRSWRAPGA